MTNAELEALRDSLIGFDTLLDALGTRVAVLEGAAVPKGTYFTQMIASFQDAPTCNDIIPTADPIDYLEIVAGTDEIYLGIQFGGYIAARNYILSAAHPHTAFAGNLQGFVAGTVITVTQIKAVSLIEAVIELLLQTGIRIGELANLRVEDLSLEGDNPVLVVAPNEGSVERTIPLNKPAVESVNKYLQVRPQASSKALFVIKIG
jgi:hypothetical protein